MIDPGPELSDPNRAASPSSVPAWLGNLAAVGWRLLATIAFLVALAYLGSLIWTVLAAIGLAIIVSVVLAPVMIRLRNSGRSRNSAAGIVWAATLGAGILVLAVLAISLIPALVDVVGQIQDGQAEVEAQIAELSLPAWLSELVSDVIGRAEGISGDAISSMVGSAANLVGILVIGSFLLFFFLRDGDKAWRWLFQWLDEEKRERIDSAGDEALERVGSFVRGTTGLAAVASVTNLLFMLVLGTPLAVALAILTFVTAYIPYFGGPIAAYLIILATWGAEGSTIALVMTGLILARFLLVHFLLRERVYAQAQELHPAVVLIVLPVGLQIGGLFGLILAVPLAAVALSVAQAVAFILEPETPRPLPDLVPAWLDGAAQWAWRGLIVLAVGAVLVLVLTTIPLVVLPVIVALILAATIVPLVDYLVRRGQSRNLATAVAVTGSAAAIIGVLALSLGSLARQADEIGRTAKTGAGDVDAAAGGYLGLGTDAIESGADAGVSTIADIAGGLGPLALVLVLSVLLTFYFLRDGAGMWASLMSHLPEEAGSELSAAGSRAFSVLGGYMVGTGAISLVGAASQLVIMWFLGLPLALPVFVLSFFGGFIPYIGGLLTTGLAFLIAVAVGDNLDIVVMAIWTLVFNIVQGNVVAPIVYNRTTHIHPAIVLAAIPAGSAVAGILGMFLVVPVLGVVASTWRSILRLMGSDVGEPVVFDDEDEERAAEGPSDPAPDPA